MKRTALIMAVVGIMAGTAWAVPTYNLSCVDLGGGLYGYTFTCDNPGQPPSAWFVKMEWRGLTQAETDQYCWPGAIPGTINQIGGGPGGIIPVHYEPADFIIAHAPKIWPPPFPYDNPDYYKWEDTWIKEEFCHPVQVVTEGANSFYVESGTEAGIQYVTVEHAYVVVDGSFAYEGLLGVGLFNPVWTPVSGVICIPEPATLSLLAIGGLALMRRKEAGR